MATKKPRPMKTAYEPVTQPLTDRAEQAPRLTTLDRLPKTIQLKDSRNHPDVERPELRQMKEWWRKGDILMGGIDAILANADELLPPLGSDEQPEEREARLRKAINTPFYSDNIERLVARPFGRPITWKGADGLPPEMEYLQTNCDGLGKSLTAFFQDHLFQAVHRGGDAVLVDLPSQEAPVTERDVLARRPVLRKIPLNDVLGWGFTVDQNGNTVTTLLRVWEDREVKSGAWGTDSVRGVRIIQAAVAGEAGYSVRYEKQNNGDWAMVEGAPFPNKRIMLHATWTQQLSATHGKSPMTHLAELNFAYIAADCEQQYGTSYARISTVWTTALEDEDRAPTGAGGLAQALSKEPLRRAPRRLTRGHRRHIRLPQGATIGILESAGSGLAAGRAELDNIEKRIERFGASHMATAGVTATSIKSDDDRDTSNLRAWATRTENTATACVRDVAELMTIQLPADFGAQVFRDWSAATEREQAFPAVVSAWDRHLVPARTVHNQLRRFGAIAESETSEQLLEEARQEAEDAGADEAAKALEAALAAAGGDPNAVGGGNDPRKVGAGSKEPAKKDAPDPVGKPKDE